MRIKPLSADVANQIAAGEVVERPASVVKEVLENAIDANATTIQIDIEYGGVNRIKIADDGEGIEPDDLRLAIQAHATSKINRLNDLYALSSMGFRGEALASIASVSKLTILSKHANYPSAFLLDAQNPQQIIPAARSQGTTIDVVDLFANAPVRKKFLKSARTEFQLIEALVKRFAMSHPNLSIHLSHNEKRVLTLTSAKDEHTTVGRMHKILGKGFVDASIKIDVMRAGMRLTGFVADPSFHRSQNDKQWLFLNKRIVKDKLLNHAIKQSFLGLLPEGRFPGCLLYLDVPASEVDVNVHPTKYEIRFQQPRLVHDFIVSELKKLFDSLTKPQSKPTPTGYHNYPKETLMLGDTRDTYHHQSNQASASDEVGFQRVSVRHAIFTDRDNHFLVDIIKFHHHHLTTCLISENNALEQRPLLVPVRYHVGHLVDVFLEKYQDVLKNLGITIDRLSDEFVVIRTIPKMLPQLNIQQFLNTLMENKGKMTRASLIHLLIDNNMMSTMPFDEDIMGVCQSMISQWDNLTADMSNPYKGMIRKLDEKVYSELLSE